MSWYRRLFNTASSERVSTELDRELEFHLAERMDELVEGGMSEAEARREARLRFGNPSLQKERARDRDVLPWLESLLADLRYAFRSLWSNPAFAAVAVLSLGLGIGANTAIFSLIDALLLKPLPVSRPEELMRITIGDGGDDHLTNPIFESLRRRQDAFSGVFAFSGQRFDLASGGEVRPVEGAWVTGDFFPTLGIAPAAGRLLAAGDDHRGCAPVAVLGHDFWRSAYGGDRGVVGRTVALDGHPFEIVGVAAPGFFGAEVGRVANVYAPLCSRAVLDGGNQSLDERSFWFLQIAGRRLPGLGEAEVAARLAAISPAVFAETVSPDWDEEGQRSFLRNVIRPVPAANGHSGARGAYRPALLALMAVVGLVLLIACANVANLLLARAAARRREVAIRLAIGAGRGRLFRQLLTESLVLAALGAAVGLLFAVWVRGLLMRFLPAGREAVWLDLSVDGRLLAFTLAVAVATAILFGVAPAWRSVRVDPQRAMKSNERGIADGRSRFRAGKALVVGQIALSLVLVLGAGLLLGSFRELATLDPGFDREGVLLASVQLRGAGFTEERLPEVRREILDRVREIPGVRSAGASAITPISGAAWNGPVEVEGFTPAGPRDELVFFNAITDGYFQTLRTRLIAGRDFGPGDGPGAPRVAIINEALARKFFPGVNPVGRRMGVATGPGDPQPVEVVGVVGDAKYRSLREEVNPVAYLPMAQQVGGAPGLNLEIRGAGGASSLIPAVTAAVGTISPEISLGYTTLSDQVSGSLSRERLLATLTGFFGALALLLAAVGLYGTMAYAVAQRRSEIAVRIAVGAAGTRVMRLVMGEVGRLVAAGILVGGVAAWVATRWVSPFLFGLTASDPATWAIAALVLAAAALAAGALPAWQAARVDPIAALRTD